jgi:hypothetical protein
MEYERNADYRHEEGAGDEMTEESMEEETLHMLHLPPGLDLLFSFLDAVQDDHQNAPQPTFPGPTPYSRTPTLN